MQTRRKDIFTTVRTEGGILPADLLQRIVSADKSLAGLTPESYHLAPGEKINEAINRAWNRLQGSWETFRAAAEKLSTNDPGTSATRERWLLPLFQELGYGRLRTAAATDIEGKTYAISHSWGHTPIHLVGCMVEMDRPTRGVVGAARSSPHSLTQELLNRSDAHLWAFVSNGKRLRILRDNKSLTRQSYVEFDLEAMFEGELYSDFVPLWLLCHQSRVESELPEQCWLEKWSQLAQEQGTRALDQLRDGVEQAITALGRGFLLHPSNRVLREHLRAGSLSTQDYYRQLLRVVYRLLFLFVAEDRELLLDPNAPPQARDRYLKFYATTRLRRLAERQRGTRHTDLYQGLRLVLDHLYTGCPDLALPALGSFLFSPSASADLNTCDLANSDLLEAIRALAFTIDGSMRRPIDYKNLRSEELGSVYEALLEQHPELSVDAGTFSLRTAAGSERKTTGSYYTPESLVQCLLDSALDPVLDEAVKKPNPEQAILALKVCDPACGSGHFLIAAAHRIAKRLANVRTGDEEPSPEATRTALRDVIGRCVYGVDLNSMAVELCKVALWMEALEPGRPLSFLDHHIQCGNSLLGTTPSLIEDGIPDAAFDPIEGDDKVICTEFKKKNRVEREGQGALYDPNMQPWERLGDLTTGILQLNSVADDTLEGVQKRQVQYEDLVRSQAYENGRLLADAWSATFVWKKVRKDGHYPLTTQHLRQLVRNPYSLEPWMREEIKRLTNEYQFFHWHLAFPGVFQIAGASTTPSNGAIHDWNGGFDVILGNPPWELTELKEKEWFSTHVPEIATARNSSARKQMIEELSESAPSLYQSFKSALRHQAAFSSFLGSSGMYPLCGHGRINTYAVFAERAFQSVSTSGRVGIIVPTGIATDDTTKEFFQALVTAQSLVSVVSFENEDKVFPAVHHATKFCLITFTGKNGNLPAADYIFYARSTSELSDKSRHFRLTLSELQAVNPNTLTAPVFRSQRDAQITSAAHSRWPVLLNKAISRANPWKIELKQGLFNMASDSGEFRDQSFLRKAGWTLNGAIFQLAGRGYIPLYESKMFHYYDHRFGTYYGQTDAQRNQGKLPEVTDKEHQVSDYVVLPNYWVPQESVDKAVGSQWQHDWFIAFRKICRNTDSRTFISAVLPRTGLANSMIVAMPALFDPLSGPALIGCFSSFAFDYLARQKLNGTNMSHFVTEQLPVPPPSAYTIVPQYCQQSPLGTWISSRVLELTFTAHDLTSFARDCGYSGDPFTWDNNRRFLLRCELDAAYFHLYGMKRDDVGYIMDTFPIVKRKDEAEHEEYRTKRVILEIYDAIEQAIETGVPYETRLDPPPANGWTPPEDLIQAAFTAPPTDTPVTRQSAAVHEDPEAFDLVPPPSLPKPLRDKDGQILRVRVYNQSEEVVMNAGVVVAKTTQAEGVRWTILPDGETTIRHFQSPPAVLKRLKPQTE